MAKIENFNGKVIKQVIKSKKLNFGKKIRTLTISDLHGYIGNQTRAARLAEAIKKEAPDIIFIAGDSFNGGKAWEGGADLEKLKEFVRNISQAAPVCITWGNHDLRGEKANNKDIRLDNFKSLEDVNPGRVFPLYNDKVFINGMEIVGYVPKFDLMENEGLKAQIHGIAHDKFIDDYHKEGVKFEDKPGTVTVYLGHDPHLIAASENGVGLEDLSVCDFFISGHLHDGYKPLLAPIDKMKKALTGQGMKSLELDRGYTEQVAGLVDKDGNYIKGSWRPWLGAINLCRGIVYVDNGAQQRFLQMPDGKFYKNASTEPNVQDWQPIDEEVATKEIADNNLHFMLISQGVAPSFLPQEKDATLNVVEIVGEEEETTKHR